MKKSVNMVAGENIPYIKEAFASLGNLTVLPGRSITSSDLQDTNVLLIRSITRVDDALLKGTPVEFVGSASAGVDHIDEAYLKTRNIGFTSAAGSNANSVAEYVLASLLFLGKQQGFSLKGKTIGIIGVGNIGKLVKNKVEALGMLPVLHDPPLAETGQVEQRSLAETLSCDVVTLHTPLTTNGPYPTYHMLNEQTLQWLNPAAIFINAARGEVVETHALLDAITQKRIGPTIIDVWEDEPGINWDLFQAVTIGTPHIAGHSLDGKANGTFMIYAALCKHLDISPTWNPVQVLPTPTVPSLTIDYHEQSDEELIQEMVTTIYDLEADYHCMQQLLAIPQKERPRRFDELRKNYPVRREFHRTNVTLPKNQERLQQLLVGIGFLEFSEEA